MTTMAQTACPRCNGAIAAGAQFCGSCGAQLGAAPPPPPIPQPPPAPQPPPLPQMARGFTGASGGNTKQATFNGTAQDAYNQALNALNVAATNSKGAVTTQVTWQQAPHSAKFETDCKSFWSTAGFGIKYDGDLQVQPAGPGQVTARYSLKLQWGSAAGLLITQGLCALIAATSPYLFGYALFFILGVMGYTAWNVASNLPEKALQQFMHALQASGATSANAFTQQQQPSPQAHAPQPPAAPQPVVSAPAPAPAAPTNDANVIMEQIKQLGALKDAGILTAEEFETKKAELLKRL